MAIHRVGANRGSVSTVSEIDAVVFSATVYKVQTLVDGGLRVTFDLPESAIPQASRLMEFKRTEHPLRVACAASDDDGTQED